jgi:hypothetical protein
MKTFKRPVAWLSVVCMLSLLLSSCLKNNVNYAAPPVALVSFFQASPDQPGLDLYFNGDKVNWGPISYGTGIGYFRAYSGLRTVNLYLYGVMNEVFTDTITLQANNVYSLFLANTAAKSDLVAIKDTINQPAANTANVRFIDLSPDAPAVDLALNDTVKVSNRSYKGYSTFIPVTGNKSYTIDIRQKGTTNVLATLAAVTLSANNVYTIILTGLANGTTSTDKLAIYYVTNAYY